MLQYYILVTMKSVTIDNVEAMIEKPIKASRIIGLKAWEGKKAIVVITEEEADNE